MPPRHAYWTILIDDQPTAFRAHDPEELLPTLNRLREKNATAVMKWFERGKLFESRDQARDVGLGQGERRWEGPRPERDDPRDKRGDDRARQTRDEGGGRRESRPEGPRDRTWRPGGEHRDPRQKYKDAKKAKWNWFKDKIRERHEDRAAPRPESFTPPHGDKLRDREYRQPPDSRDRRPEWRDDRPSRNQGPRGRAPSKPWTPGTGPKPHGDKLRPRAPRPEWRREDDSRDSNRRDWADRPPRGDANRGGYRGREDSRQPRPQERPGPSRGGWTPKGPPQDRERPTGGFSKKPFGPPRWGNRSGDTRSGPSGGRGKTFNRPPADRRPPKRRKDDDE